jgi:hypothetical protein
VASGDKANTSNNLQDKPTKPDLLQTSEIESDSALVELVDALHKIDSDSNMSKLNETTISDNSGGRIVL